LPAASHQIATEGIKSERLPPGELQSLEHICRPGLLFKNIFGGRWLYFSFSTHKQCIHIQSNIHNSIAMFSLKSKTLAGFEPGSSWRMRCPLRHATRAFARNVKNV
jgi:hypothetical protein